MAETAIKSHPYLLSILVQANQWVGKVKIKDKESSWFWRHVPSRWRNCITVFGSTFWFPGGHQLYPDKTMCLIVTHELSHMMQKRQHGLLGFYARYLSPQVLILALSLVFMVPLLGVAGALIPWPSPWRSRLEEQAYVTESWLAWKLGMDSSEWKKRLQDALASDVYWGMASDTRAYLFGNKTVIDIWVRNDFSEAEQQTLEFAQKAFGEWQKQEAREGGKPA